MVFNKQLIFKQNFRYFGAAGLLLLGFEALKEIGMPSEISSPLILCILLVLSFFIFASACFSVPFGPAIRAWPAARSRFWRYALKYLAVTVIAMLPTVILALLESEDMPRRSSDVAISHLFQLATLPLTLAFIGTWLPATVFDMGTGFMDALRRTRKVFWPLMWRLLLIALADVILRLIFSVFHSALGKAPRALVFADNGAVNVMTSIFILVIYLIDLFALTLTNVTISRQFLKAEGVTLLSQDPRNLANAAEQT